MKSRLFVISNRLPLTIEQVDGKYQSRQSSGGLVSSVNAYLKNEGADNFSETFWVGAPDCNEKVWHTALQDAGQTGFNYVPVFVNRKKYEHYYNGFSNSLLWPLFHYFPSYAEYNDKHFDAYMHVNAQFAERILEQARKDDIVWIHDYHLLPLAGMLRKQVPTLTIGFFLHIPFPSYELFRVIPKHWQYELLAGMLGADLVGFHTIDYAQHFHACVARILKAGSEGQLISWQNRQVKADAFPISIDYDLFHNAYDAPQVAEMRNKYVEMKGDKKLIFSIDRLDYTKGLSNRLKGYEEFLVQNPEYKEQVLFALALIPSRDGITKYAERKKIIDEHIGSLNSRLGSIAWQPVLYHYNHLSFEELVGLYTACDLALITPLRDGMNLVSKEFVASRKDSKGVLVLSEMAGSANELTEALLINPNDAREIADKIKQGLEMNAEEQAERLSGMQQKINGYNVNTWAADFFRQLLDVKKMQLEFEIKFIDNLTRVDMLDAYAKASRRLFLLDYDGSLMPFAKYPPLAAPDDVVLDILQRLGSNVQNDVFIISGRDSATLQKWLGHLPVGLVAEHGAKMRFRDNEWHTAADADTVQWMNTVLNTMEKYVARCPNSFIEAKEFSVAWHYRNADPAQAQVRAAELFGELTKKTDTLPLNVLNGHKVIEARSKYINKGIATATILDTAAYDFVLAIGDDKTDEDMFARLARLPHSFTIKIGSEASFAKYNLHSPAMAQSLLQTIALYSRQLVG